ncbi:hypothetical protein N7456_002844 [Penicillium angulare]|uniref:dUTP diphosphatase n=1 Tax=Penicillium angulare TaxID=116970 RepID=A0A9W9KGZ7_9EURO|nr:hypothetical protein N7456_002844 [Penicillium angulare]
MTKETTPPAETTTTTREPPSLPTSPLPKLKEGDRIAQLIVERIYTPEVTVVEELEESVRGAGGFGSTGV